MKKVIMVVSLFILLILLYFILSTDVHKLYKMNWNINIPNPNKCYSPIEYVGAGDVLAFDIMYYDKEDIENLINKKEFSKIDVNLSNFYYRQVKQHFFKYLSDDDLNKFNSYFDKDKIFNDNNYYAILEDDNDGKGYSFNLLIIDTNNNIMYSLNSNYDRNYIYIENYNKDNK